MPTAITVEEEAKRFGNLIRTRRKALGMRQEDIVFATGVGRRYLIDLEAGKPTSWIGPALMIARHLGIEFVDSSSQDAENSGYDYDLPELKDEENNSAQAESE
jgi:transcriptional regulator with XRE-family HTH domain